MNIFEHEVVKELIEKEIPFTVKGDKLYLEGFYKSDGMAYLAMDSEEEGRLALHTRYGDEDSIVSFKDILYCNLEWWEAYSTDYPIPSYLWLPYLLEAGLVKEETVVRYVAN